MMDELDIFAYISLFTTVRDTFALARTCRRAGTILSTYNWKLRSGPRFEPFTLGKQSWITVCKINETSLINGLFSQHPDVADVYVKLVDLRTLQIIRCSMMLHTTNPRVPGVYCCSTHDAFIIALRGFNIYVGNIQGVYSCTAYTQYVDSKRSSPYMCVALLCAIPAASSFVIAEILHIINDNDIEYIMSHSLFKKVVNSIYAPSVRAQIYNSRFGPFLN